MKQKTPHSDIGAQTRAQIAKTLPVALEKAIRSYHDFMDTNSSDETSMEYKNKQSAAKTGLAHIELLMKLASMVDAFKDDQASDLQALFAQAKKELEGHNE